MDTRDAHVADVVALSERLHDVLINQGNRKGLAALLLLVRTMLADLPDDVLPLSFVILKTVIPEVLHECEPIDEVAPSADVCGPVP